jgi:hypothetical protein
MRTGDRLPLDGHGREVVFWRAEDRPESPVLKVFKTFPRDVQAFFMDRLNALANDPSSAIAPKPLRHVQRMREYIHQGVYGHYRVLLRDESVYIVILDAFKKQKNDTPTETAVVRWNDWERWHK